MDALLRRLLRAAFRRGIAGNWAWLVIALCTFIWRRILADRGGKVSSLKIAPGEQVLISVHERAGNGKKASASAKADLTAGPETSTLTVEPS
jgi:hypothetical protein